MERFGRMALHVAIFVTFISTAVIMAYFYFIRPVPTCCAYFSNAIVTHFQKISDLEGSFAATIDDGDQLGIAVDDIGDIDDDGVIDLIVGAWRDDDGGTNYGAVYILFMRIDGTVRDFQKISDTEGGFTGTFDPLGFGSGADDFGQAVAGIGDMDHDGIEDVMIGERANDDGGSDRGAAYVVFLNADGTVKAEQKISDTAGNFLVTFRNFDNFGGCMEALSDINGDGIEDLVVCAAGLDFAAGVVNASATDRGGFYELEMNTDGTVQNYHIVGDGGRGFPTGLIDNGDKFGTAVAVLPDINGDGVDDWAIGAPLDDNGGADDGAVYILLMNVDGTVADVEKISNDTLGFAGQLDAGDRFGASLSAMGDLDADGISELAVGAWQDDDGGTNRGAAYVLFLNADGTLKKFQKLSSTEGHFSGALDDSDQIGFSVAAIDDLNGDGFKELAIGSFGDDDGGSDRGAVWLLFLDKNEPSPDFILPTNVSFKINDGDACTTSPDVTLSFSGENIYQYIAGNDALFTGGAWQTFADADSVPWRLTEGQGEKTVYVRFRSRTRNQADTLIQSIQFQPECLDGE